jgi:hypothetical protein
MRGIGLYFPSPTGIVLYYEPQIIIYRHKVKGTGYRVKKTSNYNPYYLSPSS